MADSRLNMKRVRDTLIWLVLILGILGLLFLSVRRKSNARVKTLVVNIEGARDNEHLISEQEVKQILELAAGKTITKANIRSLNLRTLEARLNKDKRIERADLYVDSKSRLNARIVQKKPVLRVVSQSGPDYYLDENAKRVPVTAGSSVRVPVVTGIRDTFSTAVLKPGSNTKLRQVFDILHYVANDGFLSALIEQAEVEQDSVGDIVLIPKIGRERLIFGDSRDIDQKFDKLKIFYRDGMPKLGWSRYKTLNLKYANQVSGMLANPELAQKIKPVMKDSLQVADNSATVKNASIHH